MIFFRCYAGEKYPKQPLSIGQLSGRDISFFSPKGERASPNWVKINSPFLLKENLLPQSSSLPLPGRRVIVVGGTGSGKTSLAEALARKLGLPHAELDSLYWDHDWQPMARETFWARLNPVISQPGWVLDGNYSFTRPVTWVQADTLVWLDLPLGVNLWRLWRRSIRRVARREVLWNGNVESFREQFFSRESLFVYLLKSVPKHRREYPLALQQPEYRHLRLVHLKDSAPGEHMAQ